MNHTKSHPILVTGRLMWIGLRPAPKADMEEVKETECITQLGLAGDRYGKKDGHRQVTIIQHEHLAVIAQLLGCDFVRPAQLRRNLAISGANVLSLVDSQFRVGSVLFQGTGICEPCERMETTLGPGGMVASVGHGGITARILAGGTIRVGDPVLPS